MNEIPSNMEIPNGFTIEDVIVDDFGTIKRTTVTGVETDKYVYNEVLHWPCMHDFNGNEQYLINQFEQFVKGITESIDKILDDDEEETTNSYRLLTIMMAGIVVIITIILLALISPFIGVKFI